MSNRLTNIDRQAICNRALQHRFQEPIQELIKNDAEFAKLIYDFCFSKADQEKMNSLPKGWLERGNSINVQFGGNYTKLYFSGIRFVFGELMQIISKRPEDICFPIPSFASGGVVRVFSTSDDFSKENERILRNSEKIKSQVGVAKRTLLSALSTITTTKKLLEVYPDLEPFVKGKQATNTINPIVPSKGEINQLFGLPVS